MICHFCRKEIHGHYIPVRENLVEVYFCDEGCFSNHYGSKDRRTAHPLGENSGYTDNKDGSPSK